MITRSRIFSTEIGGETVDLFVADCSPLTQLLPTTFPVAFQYVGTDAFAMGDIFHRDDVVDGRGFAHVQFDGGSAPIGFREAAAKPSADFRSKLGPALEVSIRDSA